MKHTKRSFLCLLLAAMLLCAAGCSAPAASAPEETAVPSEASVQQDAGLNGSYETEGQGNNGPVKVRTTFENGVIAAVEVLEHAETAGIGDLAAEKLTERITAANSIQVDAVSGATNTSRAILDAVRQAITLAGGDPADFEGSAASQAASDDLRTEVLVIGAGGAGLSAANAAVRNGSEVLVIEKNGAVGGATAVSGGGFMGGASRLQKELGVEGDTPEQIYADLLAGGKDNDETMLRLLSENCGHMVDWLYYELQLPVNQKVSSSVEHTYDRGFSMEGGASAITAELLRVLNEAGGQLLTETRATGLLTENGAVVGAKVTSPEGEYNIFADSVILATGGYGANKELLPESVSSVLYYGPATSTGDGLLMAREIGADAWYLDHIKIYPQGVEIAPGIGAVSTGGSMVVTRKEGAIYVNSRGERVINENVAFTEIRDKTLEQEDQILYLVMDQPAFSLWKETSIGYKFFTEEQIDSYVAQNGGTPMFANAGTIEEAAAIAGIDPAALSATVAHWNEMVEAGADEDFGNSSLFAIDEGPFYIVEQKLRFASTLGGLKIDTGMHVLDEAGQPIPGLYAAGEIIGGAHGQDSMPTCNVSWALTTGMLAGNAVSSQP